MKKTVFPLLVLLTALSTFSCKNAEPTNSSNQQVQMQALTPNAPSKSAADTTQIRGFDLRFWHIFTGKKGADTLHLTFYVSDNGDVKGHYHYETDEVKIPILGKVIGSELVFRASKTGDLFKGLLYADDALKGIWTNAVTAQTTEITLRLSSASGYEDFYKGMDGSADAIESFMKQVKTAVLNDDAQWLAAHTRFPINVDINNQQIEIQNETELIQQSPAIFHAKFKEKIRTACPLDLFNKRGEAMLGNGEIWIANTVNSTENSFDYMIIAINN